MIRKLIQRFNRSMSERISPMRLKYEFPIKIWFEPDEAICKTARLKTPAEENLFIWGETQDLSRSGIAFLVPSIRIRENYLVGANRLLVAELDLPNGRAQMRLLGKRYEQIGEHLSVARYLIGASIERITPENLEIYDYFLKHGKPAKAASGGGLKLGIDKS